jgi:hypothetical protein
MKESHGSETNREVKMKSENQQREMISLIPSGRKVLATIVSSSPLFNIKNL